MPTPIRSTKGCWSCRLRKKKCDERHPVCVACASLNITCYGYGQKPGWMCVIPIHREARMGSKGILSTSRYFTVVMACPMIPELATRNAILMQCSLCSSKSGANVFEHFSLTKNRDGGEKERSVATSLSEDLKRASRRKYWTVSAREVVVKIAPKARPEKPAVTILHHDDHQAKGDPLVTRGTPQIQDLKAQPWNSLPAS